MASPPADEQALPTSVDELLSMFGFQVPAASNDSLFDALNLAISKIHDGESLISHFLSIKDDDDDYSNFDELDHPIIEQDEFESLLAYLAPIEEYFNFEAVMEHIFNCAKQHNRTHDEAFTDIFDMVVIGLRRGNIRKDQVERTISVGAERIKELAYWYQIPIRSAVGERIPLKTGSLTFVRATSHFPHMASHFLYNTVGIAKNGAKTVLASKQLPNAMKHFGFPGLIPKGCDPYLMKAYSFAHAAYMVDFGSLINPDDKRTLKAMASTQLNCCKVAVENDKSPYSDEFRVGSLCDPAVFKKIVDACNNLCKVVGEPELSFETAEKYDIKNNMICFFEDESKDVAAAGEEAKSLADKLKFTTSIHDFSTFMK